MIVRSRMRRLAFAVGVTLASLAMHGGSSLAWARESADSLAWADAARDAEAERDLWLARGLHEWGVDRARAVDYLERSVERSRASGIAPLPRALFLLRAASEEPSAYLRAWPRPESMPDDAEASALRSLRAIEGSATGTALPDSAALAADALPPLLSRAALAAEAGRALDRGDGAQALALYHDADSTWQIARRWIDQSDRDLWSAWSSSPPRWALLADDGPTLTLESDAIARALDPSRPFDLEETLRAESREAGRAELMARSAGDLTFEPTAEEWERLAGLVNDSAELAAEDARLALATREIEESMARDRRYTARGRELLEHERSLSARLSHSIDSLSSAIDRKLRALDEGRESARARIARRLANIDSRLELHRAILAGQSALYLRGPRRLSSAADSLARASSIAEQALLDQVEDRARQNRAGATLDALAENGWRPGLRERLIDLSSRTAAQAMAIANDRDALDAREARASGAAELASIAEKRRAIAEGMATLEQRYASERAQVVASARTRALAILNAEREKLDYGLAASLHEWSRSTPSSERRAEAMTALDHFLDSYPDSPARGDARFRLAESEIAEGQVNPARYDPATPLALFQSMWEGDLDYPHRDLVLFQIGRLESELGDPAAVATFESFLARFPGSAFVQEAEVHLGDLAFDERDYARAAPFFERASRGPAAPLVGIAWYKLGWSQFGQDEFEEAALSFAHLLDLYEAGSLEGARFDLRSEAEEYLVHCLARAGGADAFRRHFAASGSRPYEERILRGLSSLLREHSLYAEAVATDRLYLERFAARAEALNAARNLIESYERWNHPIDAETARLELAERFSRDGAWSASMPDSLREAGDLFAREATVTAAEEIHQRARGQKRGEDWRTALGLYERLLVKWPNDPRAIAWLVSGGEAASRLDRFDDAASYFHRAAAGEGELAREAAFQELAAMDAAVNAETQPSIRARRARAFVASSSAYRARRGDDPRGKDLLWREGELGLAADADSMALRALTEFAHRYPDDARGSGALARVAERSEASGDVPRAAAAWGELARLWPERSDADVALYKSAAAYARIDSIPAALVAYRRLLRAYPTRELSRDAALEVGRLEETRGDSSAAAEAFADFAARYPKDTEAGAALLHAIALWDGAHAETQADATRLAYLDRYPEDLDAQFEFRERFARRELDERRSAGTLALVARPAAPARSSRGVKKRAKDAASDSTPLAAYLALAVRHPEHANADFLAEVDFARGEEARADYDAARLSLPLDRSLAVKRAALERCLAEYRATLDHHVARWSEAATYRMGEAVVAFGDALVASPRPSDLSAEDRAGYDQVVEEQAWGFFDRGEEIWGELLEANAASADSTTSSEWVEKTRHALWPRVAARFLHYPEAVHPVLLPDEGSHD